MADKLSPKRVALTLASVLAILYIVCAIFFALSPETGMSLFKNIFHGIDISQIAQTSFSVGTTIIGLIEIIIYSLIIGWLFAVIYNKFNK